MPSVGSRVPHGTFKCFRKDIESSIMISIEHQPTRRTDMRPLTQRFLYPLAASTTVLGGELWSHRYHRHVMHVPVVVEPPQEPSPRCIADGLRQLVVLDHIADLKVFIGNQIARCDQRVRTLAGEILTLPLDFQVRHGQSLASLFAIGRLLLLLGYTPMKPRQLLLSLAQKARIVYRIAIRVRVECLQPHIDPYGLACGLMHHLPLCLDAELDRVAIGSSDDAHAFDLLLWKGFDGLLLVPYQAEASYARAVREGDVSPIEA